MNHSYVPVAGGVSLIVVVTWPSVGGVTGWYGPVVPSTPVVGCGGALPRLWELGVSLELSGGLVIVGG